MYMTKMTYHYAHGPSHTVRLHRSLFKKVYGKKLKRPFLPGVKFRKGVSGYHCPPL